jgi:hypothetical protein
MSNYCSLNQAFPNLDKNIVNSYTNLYNPDPLNVKNDNLVFNSITANTANMNKPFYVKETEQLSGEIDTPIPQKNKCPSCHKSRCIAEYDVENDVMIIGGLALLFFVILYGK